MLFFFRTTCILAGRSQDPEILVVSSDGGPLVIIISYYLVMYLWRNLSNNSFLFSLWWILFWLARQ